ncbi:MAG: zinc ribbon domain-containing protein [Halobacteriales archaeon]
MRDSKITFRVSDDLLERVDRIDESRSEIMRDALRTYLEGERESNERREPSRNTRPTLDTVLRDMVEKVVEEAVDERLGARGGQGARDGVNVTVNVPETRRGGERQEVDEGVESHTDDEEGARKTCPQCGEVVDEEHVHCPNCGAKASGRVFCDCGDEVRTDWSFCPSCGRRTPTSHALSNE